MYAKKRRRIPRRVPKWPQEAILAALAILAARVALAALAALAGLAALAALAALATLAALIALAALIELAALAAMAARAALAAATHDPVMRTWWPRPPLLRECYENPTRILREFVGDPTLPAKVRCCLL